MVFASAVVSITFVERPRVQVLRGCQMAQIAALARGIGCVYISESDVFDSNLLYLLRKLRIYPQINAILIKKLVELTTGHSGGFH